MCGMLILCHQNQGMVLLVRDGLTQSRILIWVIGSLNGRVWEHWALLWPWACVSLPLGFLSAGLANVLHLGDEVAAGLGARLELGRVALLGVAALLTAGAVSVVGAVAFVGLIGPHLTRRLVGEDARRVFPLSALLSAVLLLAADIVAQGGPPLSILPGLAGVQLPVGAVTALLGAPFFLYLVRKVAR
jgi:iron complex transport system permease protein